MRHAEGSDVSDAPPHPVDDANFKKLVAILRIAVPYTGMILSTRESPEMRRELLKCGMSQMSAGSRCEVSSFLVLFLVFFFLRSSFSLFFLSIFLSFPLSSFLFPFFLAFFLFLSL